MAVSQWWASDPASGNGSGFAISLEPAFRSSHTAGRADFHTAGLGGFRAADLGGFVPLRNVDRVGQRRCADGARRACATSPRPAVRRQRQGHRARNKSPLAAILERSSSILASFCFLEAETRQDL
jgi:hypothetical protein